MITRDSDDQLVNIFDKFSLLIDWLTDLLIELKLEKGLNKPGNLRKFIT